MADIELAKSLAIANKAKALERIQAAKIKATAAKNKKANPLPAYYSPPAMTGNAEIDSAADLTELQSGFRKRALDESNRFASATDSEYWAVISFQTREQKEAFLTALKILHLGDNERYYDGVELAKAMGIKLPESNIKHRSQPKIDKTWSDLT